jgi:hypothetical protein
MIETLPELRRLIDGDEIRLAQPVVEAAVARIKQIDNFDGSFVGGEKFQAVADIPGGGVMPLAKTGGENKNFFQEAKRVPL